MKIISHIFLFLLLAPIDFAVGDNVIPFDIKNSIAPNGKFEIYAEKLNPPANKAQDQEYHDYEYELFFKDVTTGKTSPIDKFIGYVKVLWQTDSKYFFITYRMGSNVLFSKLYSPEKPSVAIDPYDLIEKKRGKIPEYVNSIDRFTEAVKWTNNTKYIFCVAGRWNNNGIKEFEHYYELSLSGDVQILSREEAAKIKAIK